MIKSKKAVRKSAKSAGKVDEFNIVFTGVGGQGVLTLAEIVAEAALRQGYDVRMSELHGLAQRGGSIPCQVRFGKKILSSLVKVGDADLIVGMEPLEALRSAKFGSSKKTVVVTNTQTIDPISVTVLGKKYPSMAEIEKMFKGFSKKVIAVDATGIANKETGTAVASNIYLIGLLSARGLLPIKREILLDTIRDYVPAKHFEMNKRLFELAK
jgi:indolepyruvate ferredoxin oxidoreductase, beta subunit